MKTIVLDTNCVASPPAHGGVIEIPEAANSPPMFVVMLTDANRPLLLTTSVGPLTAKTDLNMLKEHAANVTIFPKCATISLEEWISELKGDGEDFYFSRPEFVGNVGIALMRTRENLGISYKELSQATSMSRTTLYKIESSHSIGGSSLGKVATYLSGCQGKSITFTFTPNNGGDTWREPFSGSSDPVNLCARLVRNLREAAGLTQAELNHRLRLPAAMENPAFCPDTFAAEMPDTAPQISHIEKLRDPDAAKPKGRSLRLGNLFSIAYFCGYTMGVDLPEVVSQ